MDKPDSYPPAHLVRKHTGWKKVGRGVVVHWPLMKKWYDGIITKVDGRGGCHVTYSDGYVTVEHGKILPLLEDEPDVTTWNHFQMAAPYGTAKFILKDDGEQRIFENSFVTMKASGGREVLAYVVEFIEDAEGDAQQEHHPLAPN